MKLFLKLSGQHTRLADSEIRCVLEGEGLRYRRLWENKKERVLALEAETEDARFLYRLAFTQKAGEIVGESADLEDLAALVDKRIAGTFAVYGKERERLGDLIWKRGHGVDLEKPDTKVLCHREGNDYVAAIEIPLDRSYTERRPQNRPYFHPTSIDPRIARALVNLANVKAGSRVLDPFCGTGGILIEAGLMGMRAIGIDYCEEGVIGCMENLRHYGLEGEIIQGDALQFRGDIDADAIVTDPPYGRSSYMTDRNKDRFYSGFMAKAAELLSEKKRMVVVVPDDVELTTADFRLKEEHSIYVHKSLTRKIYVFERI